MSNATETKLRFLIHPDDTSYVALTRALIQATIDHPEAWTLHVNEPGVIDHIGYHDHTLSSVVWSAEDRTAFHRLDIRPGRHEVYDQLLAIVIPAWPAP